MILIEVKPVDVNLFEVESVLKWTNEKIRSAIFRNYTKKCHEED